MFRTGRAEPNQSVAPTVHPETRSKKDQKIIISQLLVEIQAVKSTVPAVISFLPVGRLCPQSSVCLSVTGCDSGGDLHKLHPPAGGKHFTPLCIIKALNSVELVNVTIMQPH